MASCIDVCPLSELPPGAARIVEWEDLEIGVFNCNGEILAIEDRCSHDNGTLAEGEFDPADVHRRMPAPRLAVRPAHRKAHDPARLRSRRHVPRRRRGRAHQGGGGVETMAATPETTKQLTPEEAALRTLGGDYTERYGFHDAENYLFKAPKGLTRELVAKISEFKTEPQWMRDFRLKSLDHFLARPMPTWGSPMLAEVDFDDIHYFVRASERSERSWDDVPEDVKKTFDRLGIPEAERKFLAGVGAQYESESVYHQVNEQLEKQGVAVHGHGHRAARARGPRARVHRHAHPAQRQQARRAQQRGVVGRLVRLRPAGRARRDAAAGLLPHQHGEHGPVRAHDHHRRRGLLRALRRGLHRADLQLGLAALRGGRAVRQARRADPLHDGAELVQQRLQPGDQARAGRDATRPSSGSTATSAPSSR